MSKEKSPAIKLLLLGDSGVGKSSLMLRYAENTFDENLLSTAGVDFKVKTVFLKTSQGEQAEYRLQIWDTAGQERFKTITQAYYRGAMGVVLVYDVTDRATFDNVGYWMKSIAKYAKPHVKRLLVANKVDLENNRVVSSQEGQELAKSHNVRYVEASAKENIGVDQLFLDMGAEIACDVNFELDLDPAASVTHNVVLDRTRATGAQTKSKTCC